MIWKNFLFSSVPLIWNFYFIISVFLTIYAVQVTIFGLYYSFFFTLLIFFVILLLNFDNFVLLEKTISFKFLNFSTDWFIPEIGISFVIDNLSYFFILLVVAIALSANLYILNYFKYEAEETRFTVLINWFVLSMILLVTANNFFTTFLGWELIGLTSFLLINFWTERRATLKASFKAFSFNKVSDFFLLCFFLLCWVETGVSNNLLFVNIIANYSQHTVNIISYAIFCLVLCSSIKSAQIIGHLWLPDSMEAPVPASALIHSATLVSAGLYLLLRFSDLLLFCNMANLLIYLGSLTAAYGGIVAASQTDMKKLLAYSTVSHCGFLFVCAGLQNYSLVIVYLFMHGLFKAMTFFCVGTFIRVSMLQDTRYMGILNRIIPVDTIYLIISSINLGGLPLSFGYLYKNYFLFVLGNNSINILVTGLIFIGMLSSIVYVYRLVYYSAFDVNKGNLNDLNLEAQQKNKKINFYWSFSTITQTITLVIMLSFSVYVYILFVNYFLQTSIWLSTNSFSLKGVNLDLIFKYNKILSYILFYSLYTLLIFILLFVNLRKNYTVGFNLNFLVLLLGVNFILVNILN